MSLFGPRYPVLRRVIVTTKARESYRGLLWQRHADFLVLRESELLRERADPLIMVGETFIFSANVEYIQVLPGGEL